MKEKKFLLRLDQGLYDQIAAQARAESRSVNNFIVHLLQENSKKESLESRQFVGQIIKGSDILTDSALVSVNGIYYRYSLSNVDVVDSSASYVISDANGNILTLTQLT